MQLRSCFSEVENALDAELALHERDALLVRNIHDNERAPELTQTQVRIGRVGLRTAEQRQPALAAARAAPLRVQTPQLAQCTNRHWALGGSFEAGDSMALRSEERVP